MTNALDAVKRFVRAQSAAIVWPQPGIMDAIREQEAAKKALADIPQNVVPIHPYYASVDDGQSGIVFAAHLTDEQMLAVPLAVATEILDELCTNAAGVNWQAEREHQREMLLSAYGPALADLVCQGIDEALESRCESYKRLKDHDGTLGALDSTVLDEPFYDTCEAGDEFASPATSFDFWDAVEAARELIEERDIAAASVRCGRTTASADTHPQDGDVKQAPLGSGAVGEAETPNA